MTYLPILIDLKGKKILVVGGGKIALRKVQTLIEYCAEPTVISIAFEDEILKLESEGKLKAIEKPYEKGDAASFDLVFCATGSPETDKKVYDDCLKTGALLNVADVPELCNFIMPATIRRNQLTVSIASQGSSPFLVKHLRKKFENCLPDEYSAISALAADFRVFIMSMVNMSETEKTGAFEKFLEIDWVTILREDGMETAQKLISELKSYVEKF
jgi:siroheme synthase-like protein